jgi:hypothetical protein
MLVAGRWGGARRFKFDEQQEWMIQGMLLQEARSRPARTSQQFALFLVTLSSYRHAPIVSQDSDCTCVHDQCSNGVPVNARWVRRKWEHIGVSINNHPTTICDIGNNNHAVHPLDCICANTDCYSRRYLLFIWTIPIMNLKFLDESHYNPNGC